MTYATLTDMTERYGPVEIAQLTDRINGTTIDATVLSRALTDADAEINGYLAGRYTLPLPAVPVVLLRLACDIARYFLYDDRATDQVTKRYEIAIKLLRLIGEGKVSLGLDAAATPVADVGGVSYQAADRVFSAAILKDY